MSPAAKRRRRQQLQMIQMQAMSNPNMFFYKGDVLNLERRLDEVVSQGIPITDVFITVSGNQVTQMNWCLLTATTLLGAFFIFPLIFMCYDCWKRAVYPSYQLSIHVYQKLQYIISTQNIKSIHIEVCDNNFGAQKAKLFYQMLSVSSTQSFSFTNCAVNMDFKEYQYTNFVQYMRPIKMLPMQSVMRWWTQFVQ